MSPQLQILICIIAAGLGGFFCTYLFHHRSTGMVKQAQEQARKLLEDSEKEGQQKKKELLVEGREEIHRLREELLDEHSTRRDELQQFEHRLLAKEDILERKAHTLEGKEERIESALQDAVASQERAQELVEKRQKEVETISGLSSKEAKDLLLHEMESELSDEFAQRIRQHEEDVRKNSEKISREIITKTIQRIAADHVAESTVTVVSLPSDDMKGRIIGREGRNIRTFENLTGVDLIIDDTPEAVILSCFDPMRREIAKTALEKLVDDGRIHPTRIEEVVARTERELEDRIRESGEDAAYEAGVPGISSELLSFLGRLKFRTSYGQNVLQHAVEVSKVSGFLAQELGADVRLARRGGLLHDIGKSIDQEVGAPHIEVGVDLARRFGESQDVIHVIEAHHGDVEFKSLEAILVQAADAISAARPGARRETLESYVERLEKLEGLVYEFDGVEKAYAVQAGREIRVMVVPEEISESEVTVLARAIAKSIEAQLEYPGQIKVNVVRETRSIEYAH